MDDKTPLTPSSEAANFDIGSIQIGKMPEFVRVKLMQVDFGAQSPARDPYCAVSIKEAVADAVTSEQPLVMKEMNILTMTSRDGRAGRRASSGIVSMAMHLLQSSDRVQFEPFDCTLRKVCKCESTWGNMSVLGVFSDKNAKYVESRASSTQCMVYPKKTKHKYQRHCLLVPP
ncbi:hypothetical protein GHT06_016784 [Daphnia sinensis]|uniref:Uncharacterized protein n=1 Tax=Daphnia sinensis TaxID=1820382 RepID=A0AAD5L6B7_9CRUS|nr:hypothetical protein GHT06_016784 [Daphnia sinensis]